MTPNWRHHFIATTLVLLMCAWIWWLMYEAQFLPYDDNYANILGAFGFSTLLTLGIVIAWFLKRNWIKNWKWEVIFFLITTGPLTIAYASINYPDVFGTMLKN